jgi:hypothetical protein
MERSPAEGNDLRRQSRIVVPLSVALLLAFTGALAEIVDNPPGRVESEADQSHHPVNFRITHDRTVDLSSPVPLPVPGKEPAATTSAMRTGPVAAYDSGMIGTVGMRMVTSRGGAMSSPRQRAQREIRRLIRHLD